MTPTLIQHVAKPPTTQSQSISHSLTAAARTTKGKVMERRIMKDFQIGFVENLKQEMDDSANGLDIFSSLAKVIGRKKTQKG